MQTTQSQFNNTETQNDPNGPLRVDSVRIDWIPDQCPDLSWLDQTDEEMGEGFEAQSNERKASYGSGWEMLGCVAQATVSYPIGGNSRRLQTLSSGGLWGIESDSDRAYMQSVAQEQLTELVDHLTAFGIETTVPKLNEMI